ncbi:hypothetical protein POM88_045014 [Heracleum sosnowskyi]|uniref:Uncharacterized protein n=1 Tax=Heracleum sosnowskyi TaxID=360622 RepID=A0AAD8M3E6_9APIA|nr:hypothetical protein POM88_045014 [Heracleum sosnowskyi]
MPLLRSFMQYHIDSMPKFVKAIIYLLLVIHFLNIFQIYGMVVWERIYVTSKKKRCPQVAPKRNSSTVWRNCVFCVGGSSILGSAVPITYIYPCLMWIIIRNPGKTSPMWYLNVGIAFFGLLFVVLVEIAAIRTLVVYGLDANFFHPN